jgi:methionine biosynthesis protein MetW
MSTGKLLRPDLAVIASLIPPRSRVLDIGCGDGALLSWLRDEKQVDGRGIEIDQLLVNRAIANGIPVIQGDVNSDLPHYPAQAYDYVILSQTLQTMQKPHEVLAQLTRIGRQGIVSVPNFGHWKNRLYLALLGRMPVTRTLSYQWYDTPNIHFCTISDFIVLAESLDIVIEDRVMVNAAGHRAHFSGRGHWANLFGEQGVFLLRKR